MLRMLLIAAIPILSILVNGRDSLFGPQAGRARRASVRAMRPDGTRVPEGSGRGRELQAPPPASMAVPNGSAAVEQTSPGSRSAAKLVASFDGLGFGFEGPQGAAALRNPSDNSLAVGPDHIVQVVNSRMAIYTKQGHRFPTTGQVLYGPVNTNNVFRGFGGRCEARNNGDAVVR